MKPKSEAENLDVLMKTKLKTSTNIQNDDSNLRCFSFFSSENRSLKNIINYVDNQVFIKDFDKVCVISVIGKSTMNSLNSKALILTDLFGQNLQNVAFQESKTIYNNKFIQIDGCFDISNKIILLHLTSIFDSWALANICKKNSNKFEKGISSSWPDLLTDLHKSVLLLFYISNIVIITNPTPRFDLSCINLLRIIDSTKVKLQPFVSEMLNALNGFSPNLCKNDQLAIPQLLFIFDVYDGFNYINNSNVKAYVKHFENQISRLLRKTRLINSLFTLSSTNSFVFFATRTSSIINREEYFFQKIFNKCTNDKLNQPNFGNDYEFSLYENKIFMNFILHYINTLDKKLDDQTGKFISSDSVNAKNHFLMFIAFEELIFHQKYVGISVEKSKNLKTIIDSISWMLDIDNRFSEDRCSKLVNSSVKYYQENLPSHYTRKTHDNRLILTMKHFTMQCRGSAMYKYIKNIHEECDKIWKNGRQMCEELSLTGNGCVNKIHRVLYDDFTVNIQSGEVSTLESNQNLPVMAHNSMVKFVSACDCGRRQGERDDPFTTKAANYDFYYKMRFNCHTCRGITRFKFHVYETNSDLDDLVVGSLKNVSSKTDQRESPLLKNLTDTALALSQESDASENDEKNETNSDALQQNDILLSYVDDNSSNNDASLNIDENDSFISEDSQNDFQKSENSIDEKSNSSKDLSMAFDESEFLGKRFLSEENLASVNASCSAQNNFVFDVRALPPMIHTLCHNNNLPAQFSSWSLVCLGSSSIYSHNIGIQDQQGFIKESRYLLPWNVTVILQHSKSMPGLWEGKRPPGIKHKKTVKNGTQFTVKIFIGIEYECRKGHRFIASGPDQILKTNTYQFKNTAETIAQSDMPIYMHCICSQPGINSIIAQMMRIHIVTPKAPIHVTLNPVVQMTPNASLLFHPGKKELIKLSQSSYWVLRLPMIYEADSGPMSFPQEPVSCCRLIKGCYGISDQMIKAEKNK